MLIMTGETLPALQLEADTLPKADGLLPGFLHRLKDIFRPGSAETLAAPADELARFLQHFVDAAETLGGYQHAEYQDIGMLVKPVRYDNGNGVKSYVLLPRSRLESGHIYTVVSMETGDELQFERAVIDSLWRGDFLQKGADYRERADNYDRMLGFAGFKEVYGSDDPILSLKESPEGQEHLAQSMVLRNEEQLARYERLVSFGNRSVQKARAIFAPQTADELLKVMTGARSGWIAKHKVEIVPPYDSVSIQLDDQQPSKLTWLIESARRLDEKTQDAVFACVSSLGVRTIENATVRDSIIQNLVNNSVAVTKNGELTGTPTSRLANVLDCDRFEFTGAIYKATGSTYSEGWSFSTAQAGRLRRNMRESFNEPHARVYARVFESRLMKTVDAVRDSLGIPDDIDPTDQIISLLQQQPYINKGIRLSKELQVQECCPDITADQWAAICQVIDRCRQAPMSDKDREMILAYRLDPNVIGKCLTVRPNTSTEQTAVGLASGQFPA